MRRDTFLKSLAALAAVYALLPVALKLVAALLLWRWRARLARPIPIDPAAPAALRELRS